MTNQSQVAAQPISADAKKVLDFWLQQNTKPFWFAKDEDFDKTVTAKFLATLEQAKRGELGDWRASTKGRLAEIIVLDQFSRNIFRDSSQAFAQDGMALVLAQEIVRQPDFDKLNQDERNFALMPFMHAESATIHQQALPLFKKYASADTLAFEYKHQAIIERFGRYPHRNAILGRQSSEEEIAFLQQPNSSF